MKLVPKMLRPLVKIWVPDAYIISFKLETDPKILVAKARKALEVIKSLNCNDVVYKRLN